MTTIAPARIANELTVAIAGLELQEHLAWLLDANGLPTVTTAAHPAPIERLLGVFSAVAQDDDEASRPLDFLRDFYRADVLRASRIVIDTEKLGRTLDALDLAAARRNAPAFETLLRRAIGLLTEPLLPA